MKKLIFITLIVAIIGITKSAYADIVINEIAWKGMSSTRTTDEWIEFYNKGDSDIYLDTWSISIQSGSSSKNIELVSVLEPGEYFLLCKKQIENIPCDIVESFTLSNTAVSNFVLKNNTTNIHTAVITQSMIQENGSGKYYTAQRTDDNQWIVAEPTPGAKNKQVSSGGGSTSGTGNNLDDDEILLDSDTKPENNEDVVKEILLNPEYAAKMILPEVFVQQVPITFDTEVKYRKEITKLKGKFEWSMGDGGYFLSHESKPFMYVYQEPGQYVISMRYYSSIFNEEPDTLHQKTITVLPAKTELTRAINGTVSIKNTTSGTLDIGEWKLIHGNNVFTLPKFTLVKSGSVIQIPQRIHNFPLNNFKVSLFTPMNHFSSSEPVPEGQKNIQGVASKVLQSIDPVDTVLYQPSVETVTVQSLEPVGGIKNNQWTFVFIGILLGIIGLQAFLIFKKDVPEKN